jgi:hypothetical protein
VLKVISDIFKSKKEIKNCILRYGHLPQHRYCFYLNYIKDKEKCVFFDLGANKGILGFRRGNNWRFLTDPLCPDEEKIDATTEAADYLFKECGAKKIVLEDITEKLKKNIFAAVSQSKIWRAVRPSYFSTWPVVDLKKFDENLEGSEWKRMRKRRNKFYREHKIKFLDRKKADKQELKNLVFNWKKQRHDTDRVNLGQYLKFIDEEFAGCDIARIAEVDGKIAALAAGWRFFRNDRYYSVFGIIDYDFEFIGEFSRLDEMFQAKKMGCSKFELGGGYGVSLEFKNKFHPSNFYKTHTFSILPKR